MSDLNPAPIPPSAEVEPCPTPLAWQEVVRGVMEKSTPIEFQNEHGRVTGLDFGTGPNLVFLPTATGTSRMYALTAYLLREEYRCLLLDHVTWKRRPKAGATAARSAELIAAACSQTTGDVCCIYCCGSSVSTGLHLLQQAPRTMLSAVFQGAGSASKLTWTERLLLNLATWASRPMRGTPMWMSVQAQNHRPWFPPYDESRFGFMMNEMGDQRLRDVADRLLAHAVPVPHMTIAGIQQPVLLIDCEGDGRLTTLQLDRLASQLPNVQRESMHTCGLFPYLTHPHRLVKLLRRHFSP